MYKTFNIYCDESCHLENDHKQYMVLGSVSSAYNQVRRHTERIKDLKRKHHFYGEIKWTKISQSKQKFYNELIDYFFDTDLMFRAVIVNKTRLKNIAFNQSFDEFYYKMYYYLLNHNKNVNHSYNVYLDIKDTLGATKVAKLKDILNIRYGVFRNIQNIRSNESSIMQLSDFIMGAIAYHLNNQNKKVEIKKRIITKIASHTPTGLNNSTHFGEEKMNLFFIDLR